MNEKFRIMYSLMVLYLVNSSNKTLNNTQIMTFFVDNKYTDYFTIQEVIYNLVETGNLLDIAKNNQTSYFLTDLGNETLNGLNEFISPAIMKDLDKYIKDIILNARM